MAHNPTEVRCIHCLKKLDRKTRTWDHVLPRAWYPDTMCAHMSKWKAPSCQRCNKELGDIEAHLFIRLAFLIDPDDPELSSIVKKVKNSLDPRRGRDEKDRGCRARLRESLRDEFGFTEHIPNSAILPLRRPPLHPGPQLPLDSEKMRKFAEKVIRGLEYALFKQYIDSNRNLEIHFCSEHSIPEVEKMFLRDNIKSHYRGPGFEVLVASTGGKINEAMYKVTVWKQVYFYAVILHYLSDF